MRGDLWSIGRRRRGRSGRRSVSESVVQPPEQCRTVRWRRAHPSSSTSSVTARDPPSVGERRVDIRTDHLPHLVRRSSRTDRGNRPARLWSGWPSSRRLPSRYAWWRSPSRGKRQDGDGLRCRVDENVNAQSADCRQPVHTVTSPRVPCRAVGTGSFNRSHLMTATSSRSPRLLPLPLCRLT